MKISNEQQLGISIFSQLIETILHCRLKRKPRLPQDIAKALNKLKDAGDMALHDQLGVIKQMHQGYEFRVHSVLEKHFEDHSREKYSIYL